MFWQLNSDSGEYIIHIPLEDKIMCNNKLELEIPLTVDKRGNCGHIQFLRCECAYILRNFALKILFINVLVVKLFLHGIFDELLTACHRELITVRGN